MEDKAKEFLKKTSLKNKKHALKKKQDEIDKEYQREGLTHNVLIKQLELNKLRNELDIPDEDEFLNEECFVQ